MPMGKYKEQRKVLLQPSTFATKLNKIMNQRTRAFNILLYYLGCRCSEGLNLNHENVTADPDNHRILIQITRLKNSTQTPPNPLYLDSPFVSELENYLLRQRMGSIFPFSRTTGYNMVNRHMGFYPHYYRMNRISWFFEQGYGVTDIHNWFGISVQAMDYYLVTKKLSEMGKGLK
jgi:integrase